MRYFLLLVMMGMAFFSTVPHATGQGNERCFSETGFCISGRIRSFWEQNGGLPVFGFPTGPEQDMAIEGRMVRAQQFERNRLELHPGNRPPYDVLLGRLGAERLSQMGRDWRSFPQSQPQPDAVSFQRQVTMCVGIFLLHGVQMDLNSMVGAVRPRLRVWRSSVCR